MKKWTKKQEQELVSEYNICLNDFTNYINDYKKTLIKVARQHYGKSDVILTPREMACDGFLHNLWKFKWEQEQMKKPIKEAQDILDGLDNIVEIKPFI